MSEIATFDFPKLVGEVHMLCRLAADAHDNSTQLLKRFGRVLVMFNEVIDFDTIPTDKQLEILEICRFVNEFGQQHAAAAGVHVNLAGKFTELSNGFAAAQEIHEKSMKYGYGQA